MNVRDAIQTRRSIRKFKSAPVSRETIQKILDAAVMAPSAKSSQTWRFTVVMGSKKQAMLSGIRAGIVNREAEGQDIGSVKWSLGCMEQAPVTIFVHNMDGIHPWKACEENGSWWDIATVQSVGAAIQNMLLAATALGLGSLWIADVWEAYPELNGWLETDHQMVSTASLDYLDIDPQAPPRRPMKDIVRWLD